MANLFKQSRDKQKKSAAQGAKKRTNANAQVAGVRFKKSPVSEKQPDVNAQGSNITSEHVSQKNVVSIDALDWMGQGVVRGNPVIFVEGALPNETCEIEITASKKQVANACVSRVVNASSDRVTPFCPVFEQCGGCQLQHINAEAALLHRDQALKDMLVRQLTMNPTIWQPPLSGNREQYRRKARLAIDARNINRIKLGFRESGSNKVVNIDTCPILVDPLKTLPKALCEALEGFESAKHIGHIVLVAGDNIAQVTIKHTKALQNELIESLVDFALLNNVQVVLENKKGVLTPLRVQGQTAVDVSIATAEGFTLNPSPNDFIQVNGPVNQKMIAQALAWLAPQRGERIADWFSGLGNFTLPIAKTGASVQAIEGVAEMVTRAKENALKQGIATVDWHHLDLSNKDNVTHSLKAGFDKVLLDPSREGALTVCHALVQAPPKAIVYVSCNPSTFSRDAKILIEGGYQIEKAGVAEMFPYTHHMEMMALFTQRSSNE